MPVQELVWHVQLHVDLLREPGCDPRLDCIPVSGIILTMIKSFDDKPTERLFRDAVVREFQGVARRAKRKLEALHAAARLEDLRVPPSNRLEKLRGDLAEYYSIRINDQWRIVFKWIDNNAHAVAIRDYH